MKMREALGMTLRSIRKNQNKTLRQVSNGASVALGYLSEVERGRKEVSSELLEQVAKTLEMTVSEILWMTSYEMMLEEKLAVELSDFKIVKTELRGMEKHYSPFIS
jgi:transcriptional regulator with XRE-family HTH domain